MGLDNFFDPAGGSVTGIEVGQQVSSENSASLYWGRSRGDL